MFEEPTDKISRHIRYIITDLKQYVEKRIELLALNTSDHAAEWLAESLQKGAGLILLLLAFVFLLTALAIFIGGLLNSLSLGFVIVAAPLLLIGGLLVALKPKILKQRFNKKLEKKIFNVFELNGKVENGKFITSQSHHSKIKQEEKNDYERKGKIK